MDEENEGETPCQECCRLRNRRDYYKKKYLELKEKLEQNRSIRSVTQTFLYSAEDEGAVELMLGSGVYVASEQALRDLKAKKIQTIIASNALDMIFTKSYLKTITVKGKGPNSEGFLPRNVQTAIISLIQEWERNNRVPDDRRISKKEIENSWNCKLWSIKHGKIFKEIYEAIAARWFAIAYRGVVTVYFLTSPLILTCEKFLAVN